MQIVRPRTTRTLNNLIAESIYKRLPKTEEEAFLQKLSNGSLCFRDIFSDDIGKISDNYNYSFDEVESNFYIHLDILFLNNIDHLYNKFSIDLKSFSANIDGFLLDYQLSSMPLPSVLIASFILKKFKIKSLQDFENHAHKYEIVRIFNHPHGSEIASCFFLILSKTDFSVANSIVTENYGYQIAGVDISKDTVCKLTGCCLNINGDENITHPDNTFLKDRILHNITSFISDYLVSPMTLETLKDLPVADIRTLSYVGLEALMADKNVNFEDFLSIEVIEGTESSLLDIKPRSFFCEP